MLFSLRNEARIGFSIPTRPRVRAQHALPVSAVFQHALTVSVPPVKAVLTLRAFRNAAVTINGRAAPYGLPVSGGWKSPVTLDVTGWLRAGTNVVNVWVTNTVAPPALWLRLQAGQDSLASDASWQVSLAGADWQPARLAKCPLKVPPGNPLYGAERTLDSAKRIWPVLAVFVVLSLSLVLLVEHFLRREQPGPTERILTATGDEGVTQASPPAGSPGVPPDVRCRRWSYCLLAVVLIARSALFLHNLPLLPRMVGFDACPTKTMSALYWRSTFCRFRVLAGRHTSRLYITLGPPWCWEQAVCRLGTTRLPVCCAA